MQGIQPGDRKHSLKMLQCFTSFIFSNFIFTFFKIQFKIKCCFLMSSDLAPFLPIIWPKKKKSQTKINTVCFFFKIMNLAGVSSVVEFSFTTVDISVPTPLDLFY